MLSVRWSESNTCCVVWLQRRGSGRDPGDHLAQCSFIWSKGYITTSDKIKGPCNAPTLVFMYKEKALGSALSISLRGFLSWTCLFSCLHAWKDACTSATEFWCPVPSTTFWQLKNHAWFPEQVWKRLVQLIYRTHRIKEAELSLLGILNSEFSDNYHRCRKWI